MSVRSVLMKMLVVLLALAATASPVARAGDDAAKPWVKVEYRGGSGKEGLVSLVLTSPTEAELLPVLGMKPVRGTWSLLPGHEPKLRFVAPDRTVRWFFFGDDALIDTTEAGELRPAAANTWHAAAVAKVTAKAPTSEGFSGRKGVMFFLHADGTADWIGGKSRLILAVEPSRSADGKLVLTFPDGTAKTFRRSGTAWQDTATAQEFTSMAGTSERLTCQNNLSQLTQLFIAMRAGKAGKPKYDGVALFLSWRVNGKGINVGEESVLRCPGDPHLRAAEGADRKAYDAVDLKNPPLDLCSYAVRDFSKYPLNEESSEPQIIACDRQGKDGKTPHHADGICVAFDDGSVKFMTRADLGLKPDEPIVVGPDSKVEMLRMMCHVPKR